MYKRTLIVSIALSFIVFGLAVCSTPSGGERRADDPPPDPGNADDIYVEPIPSATHYPKGQVTFEITRWRRAISAGLSACPRRFWQADRAGPPEAPRPDSDRSDQSDQSDQTDQRRVPDASGDPTSVAQRPRNDRVASLARAKTEPVAPCDTSLARIAALLDALCDTPWASTGE